MTDLISPTVGPSWVWGTSQAPTLQDALPAKDSDSVSPTTVTQVAEKNASSEYAVRTLPYLSTRSSPPLQSSLILSCFSDPPKMLPFDLAQKRLVRPPNIFQVRVRLAPDAPVFEHVIHLQESTLGRSRATTVGDWKQDFLRLHSPPLSSPPLSPPREEKEVLAVKVLCDDETVGQAGLFPGDEVIFLKSCGQSKHRFSFTTPTAASPVDELKIVKPVQDEVLYSIDQIPLCMLGDDDDDSVPVPSSTVPYPYKDRGGVTPLAANMTAVEEDPQSESEEIQRGTTDLTAVQWALSSAGPDLRALLDTHKAAFDQVAEAMSSDKRLATFASFLRIAAKTVTPLSSDGEIASSHHDGVPLLPLITHTLSLAALGVKPLSGVAFRAKLAEPGVNDDPVIFTDGSILLRPPHPSKNSVECVYTLPVRLAISWPVDNPPSEITVSIKRQTNVAYSEDQHGVGGLFEIELPVTAAERDRAERRAKEAEMDSLVARSRSTLGVVPRGNVVLRRPLPQSGRVARSGGTVATIWFTGGRNDNFDVLVECVFGSQRFGKLIRYKLLAYPTFYAIRVGLDRHHKHRDGEKKRKVVQSQLVIHETNDASMQQPHRRSVRPARRRAPVAFGDDFVGGSEDDDWAPERKRNRKGD